MEANGNLQETVRKALTLYSGRRFILSGKGQEMMQIGKLARRVGVTTMVGLF
jgi:hypothetical protein